MPNSSRVEEIFLKALENPDVAARVAYLDAACEGNVELRREVESMLAVQPNMGDFMEKPADPGLTHIVSNERPSMVIAGRYKLLEQIGEGGMGTVWVAEQSQPVKRKVALKLIKAGMDSKSVLARFEAERQALAVMDHPNIAKVLDGGLTETGRPWFVMDYVKGVPITEYCDAKRLSVPERLQLFVQVCQAVQHAHQKGIIHRDLKPSNILVAPYDDKPVPKVIDFGLAKAMNQSLTEKTLHTAHDMVLGTPLYMSPEQAQLNNIDVDTRSDIYSLGVLLYELLTGSTPVEKQRFKQAAWDEVRRIIREEEPQRPSLRLSSAHTLPSLAAGRHTEPAQLTKQVRGELDWIVMKALEKDRARRYETANGFATDVLRYLSGEPVLAAPPSANYRLRKFAQKHRAALTTTATIGLLLVAGAGISTWLAVRAMKAESLASSRLDDVQAEQRKTQEALTASQASEQKAIAAQAAEKFASEAEAAARAAESEQRSLAEQQRDEAQRLQLEAVARSTQLQQLTENQRRTIYASDMNLVRIEAQRGNLQRMREILMDQLPIHGEEDLRGFEWNYWYRYLTQAKVLQKFENFQYGKAESSSVIVPGGELVAVTLGEKTEVREVSSEKVVGTLPVQLRKFVDRTRFSATGRSVHGASNSMYAYTQKSSSGDRGEGTECTVFEPTGEKYTLTYPPDSFNHVSFLNISRDGRFVVALGNDVAHQLDKPASRLLVWNVDSQELVLNQIQPRELNRVEFSPDALLLIAYLCHGSQEYSDAFRDVAVVMDVSTGEERGLLEYNDELNDVYWMPDQQRLLLSTLGYSGANRMELLSWAIGADQPQRLSQETMPNYIKGAVSPDGRMLAVTGHTVSSIRLIDTTRGHVVNTLHNEATTIDSLTFSEDGQQIVACSTSGEVLKWSLSQHADLFTVQAKPLRTLAIGGYVFSQDQSLLAVAHSDGAVVIRTRDGEETVLKPGIPGSPRGTSRLHFSQNRHYLAHQSDVGPDGKSLSIPNSAGGRPTYGYALELYDLRSGQRLWQVIHSNANRLSSGTYSMEFSADGKQLVIMGGITLRVMNCETGAAVPFPQEKNRRTDFIGSELVKVPSTGRVLVGGTDLKTERDAAQREFASPWGSRAIVLVDAFTHEPVQRFEFPLLTDRQPNPRTFSVRVIPSPDGIHAGILQPEPAARLEIWNLRDGQQILDAPGSTIVFDADGTRAAIIHEEVITLTAREGMIARVQGLSIWDIPSRRELCQISLAGNQADAVRFSPDGQRLLTLHGKRAIGSGGAVSQGRLWDVESGREILAMPVADVNVFNWDLVFDPGGNTLTSLLLGKAAGTGGGGRSVVYDATPLSAQDDARIIAERLIEALNKETPLPSEMLTEIEARQGLKPLARETALAAVNHLSLDTARLAEACHGIVNNRHHSAKDYERALRWAEALHQAESESIRSIALLAAARFRCGLIKESLVILGEAPQETPANQSEEMAYYEILRLAIQLLALHQSGETSEISELAKQFNERFQKSLPLSRTSDGGLSRNRAYLYFEVRSALPSAFAGIGMGTPLSSQNGPSDEIVAGWFKQRDPDGDGRITEQEITSASGSNAWAGYESFDADQNKALSLDEYRIAQKVNFLLQRNGSGRPNSSGGIPIQTVTEFEKQRLGDIEEALHLAPDYAPALNAKAWLLATSPIDQIRNGSEAVISATRACELTEMQIAAYLDTLAAAHAEAKNFDEAVKWQEQSLPLQNAAGYMHARFRLKLYEAGTAFRYPATTENNLPGRGKGFTEKNSAPLLAPDEVSKARRIDALPVGISWSPDSKRLVLGRQGSESQESELQIVDIDSGDITPVVRGGVRPSWSPSPDGPNAFARIMEGQPVRISTQEIWLVNSDGTNLRKLSPGGSPSWSNDVQLFFFTLTAKHRLELRSVMPNDPEKSLKVYFEIDGYPAVSPDGTMVAYSVLGKFIVRRLEGNAEILSLPLASDEFKFVDWSPDGRFVVNTSGTGAHPGVWLIEVATGQRRLLANLNATRSDWSPDGRTIAVEESSEKKIVLLDVSSLDLKNGLPGSPQADPAESEPAAGIDAKSESPNP